MTEEQNDLFDLLGINPDEPVEDSEEMLDIHEFEISNDREEVELTETVLRQDDWDRAKGEELAERLNLGDDSLEVSDFHSLAYHLSPTIAGQCANKRRQQFVETLMDSPEYKDLHQSTRQNTLASELATVRFSRQFAELSDKDKQQEQRTGQPADQGQQPDGNMLVAVGKALKQAQDDVEAVEEMQQALGGEDAGLGQGAEGSASDLDKIRNTFNRLRNSNRLRDIFDRAGAFRRAARSAQRQKTKHGYDDMIGVELAGDPGRLLANELAYLDDVDLELDLLRRISENQAMCRQYEGVEEQAKGPVVVVVDESGSMNGPKIANAKALALAMAWIAKKQKRWCALVGFSGGSEGTRCVLEPGKWNHVELLQWLEHFYGGGTTLDVPLKELPQNYWTEIKAPKGKTDVLLITDAQVHAPAEMVSEFNQWKEEEHVRCISIVLGAAPGDLERVSNEVHCIPNLTTDCEAVTSCLSI